MLAGDTVRRTVGLLAVATAFQVTVLPVTFLTETTQEHVTMQVLLANDDLLKVRPAWLARSRSTRPEPILNGSAGVTPSGFTRVWTAVLVRAVLTCQGVQSGCCCITRAAEPVICGAAMLVPWKNSYQGSVAPAVSTGEDDERMLTPGAVISGLSTLGSPLGPTLLKPAITSW